MKMKLRQVQSRKDWRDIKKLYNEAFPANEKKPFWLIRRKHRQKAADVWVMDQESEFVGLAITMNGEDLVLLDYFAVSKNNRDGGIGSEALCMLQKEILSCQRNAGTWSESDVVRCGHGAFGIPL